MDFLIELETIVCNATDCGITFAVPSSWKGQKKRDHSVFYCPNGHARVFKGESEEEKLRRERDVAIQQVARRDDTIRDVRNQRDKTERRLNATKGVVTRIKNRVGHGVCPCCDRSFGNLTRHMAHRHPDYAKSPVLEAAV